MSMVRTLPIRVPPAEGEALDSWVEAVAHRLDTYLKDLLPALGILPRRSGVPGSRWDWAVALSDTEAEAIAAATGIEADQVHRMTLRHYDRRALSLKPHSMTVNQRMLWGRGRGSRFCPSCLADSAGRWKVSWRLGWSFACLTHNRLLADDCPGCERPQRMRPHSGYGIPVPGRCANATQGSGTGPRCRHALHHAATPAWTPESAVIQAQHLLNTCIEKDIADFGIYAANPQPAAVALADIRAVAARFLMVASRHPDLLSDTDLVGGIPAEVLAGLPATDRDSRFPDRPGSSAPLGAAPTAAAVLAALRILSQRNVHQAGQDMRALLDAARSLVSPQAAVLVQSWGADISPYLKTVHLAALVPRLQFNEQLRYRTITAAPSKPATGVSAAARRARKIPTLAWPWWWLRIAPSQGAHDVIMRQALSGMLLLVGSRLDAREALARLGSELNHSHMTRMLHVLGHSGRWDAIQEALIRVTDYLDATDTPIDYHRRRRLDYRPLLPDEQWLSICRTVGIAAGQQRRADTVRTVLNERLSALPATHATEAVRNQMIKFPAWQTPALAESLDAVARAFLDRHGLADEPLTWQLPADLLNGLDLPGPDPDTIDPAALHQIIRGRTRSSTAAAQELSTTPAAVRFVLAHHPAPLRERTDQGWRPNAALHHARQALTHDELTQLYTVQEHTLKEIGSRIGVSPRVITTLAAEYAIPLRQPRQPGHRRTVHIDQDWLYEQYIVKHRSATDLAAERHIALATLLRRIKESGIETRERGGRSHQRVLHHDTALQRVPPLLRPAFTGSRARARLERFAVAASYDSLNKAGKASGITLATLSTTLRRLEEDLGLRLLERASPSTPMRLTDSGRRILKVIRAWQDSEGNKTS
ncbi:TniQ family protein [Streptomyces sp. H39-C1]|uniref:TniQ family protein n=1 Tax=Streptomyces sp. H39-C1 TaxID=3004355 RepID=UPI0022AEBD28|nr:TniQ family protein [Streptomyces sp. H39-C1]MCZ4095251.1 TniQ family protein [Streptomyces sp. H39-C1]